MNLFELLKNQVDWDSCLDVPDLEIQNACTFICAYLVASTAEQGKLTLVLVESEKEGSRLESDINVIMGKNHAMLFPARDFVLSSVLAHSREYEQRRIEILDRILQREARILIVTSESLRQFVIPKEVLIPNSFSLKSGMTYKITDLAERLIKLGYSFCELIESVGQFAIRGGIVDIWSPGGLNPIRIEFLDNELENMFEIDSLTNRRGAVQTEVKILPAREVIFESDVLIEKLQNIKKECCLKSLEEDLICLQERNELEASDKYFDLIYNEQTIIDYLPEDTRLFVCDSRKVKKNAEIEEDSSNEQLLRLKNEGAIRPECKTGISFSEAVSSLIKFKKVALEHFGEQNVLFDVEKTYKLESFGRAPLKLDLAKILEEVTLQIKNGNKCIILAKSAKNAKSLESLFKQKGIQAQSCVGNKQLSEFNLSPDVWLLDRAISAGIQDDAAKLTVLSYPEDVQMAGIISEKKMVQATPIQSLADLKIDDYVVHVSHGIGIFKGLTQLVIDSVTKDFVRLEYAGSDVLFLPATQLDSLSKYLGNKKTIKLNKLSGKEWHKAKSRVKSAVDELARDLVVLYAKRAQTEGYAFSKDSEWQNEFELSFDYEETSDQARCIKEIKKDMESRRPMDRLLCGDVGVGKTEVALRAAFKCIMDSKQVAIVAPTTLLAWQHYRTAIERLGTFPIKVELLSRFKTPEEQKQVIKRLKTGEIDVVIGTHRILQNDVSFRDIGLVIVDEEQRFGVRHKEKLKELKHNVDFLSISATPIPRTLNMAMMGVKDISALTLPPQNRLPIQTNVLEYNEFTIKEAIRNEIRRGGQVFYVHNRVETICDVAARIQKISGEGTRIVVAHGQMSHEQLTDAWQRLIDRKADVLVCTTIIETGVDIPNCNTLIVENAQNLGLSQLHQLRGRVGRSNRKGFAYMFYKKGGFLSDIAQMRLDAIKEFAQFGAGIQIAMRDLEIRGAGNILGEAQHGHIDQVGYDMYIKLLNEAISKETGEGLEQNLESPLIDLEISAFIPERYIPGLSTRLFTYKKIAAAKSASEVQELKDELEDIYGSLPKEVLSLLEIVIVKEMAQKLHVAEIKQQSNKINIFFHNVSADKAAKILQTAPELSLVCGKDKAKFTLKIANKAETLHKLMVTLSNLSKLDSVLANTLIKSEK